MANERIDHKRLVAVLSELLNDAYAHGKTGSASLVFHFERGELRKVEAHHAPQKYNFQEFQKNGTRG